MDKNFEPGEILKQSDYSKPSTRNLKIAAALVILVFVAFVVPLLS